MASDARSPSDAVERPLSSEDDSVALDFFQALRRLECAHRDRPRFGEAMRASDEPVRLGQDPSLAFTASSLTAYQPAEGAGPARVSVGFFGAFGPNGPLPLHLSEYALQRARNERDSTFASFVDVFHHRLLLLFYRAWANARPVVSHDRPESDRFAGYVGALSGQDPGFKGKTPSALDRFSLHTACHFVAHTRHSEGLEKLVSAYFGVPVRIEEFVGEWLTVPDDYTWKLGRSKHVEGAGKLGLGTRVGRRYYERQSRFRLVLGPLKRKDYECFMPDGAFLADLTLLVERYAGQELSWDLRLILQEPERRPTRLDGTSRLGRSAHLVRNAQHGGRPFQDLIFTPLSQAG